MSRREPSVSSAYRMTFWAYYRLMLAIKLSINKQIQEHIPNLETVRWLLWDYKK